jgi:hypothetical protein
MKKPSNEKWYPLEAFFLAASGNLLMISSNKAWVMLKN